MASRGQKPAVSFCRFASLVRLNRTLLARSWTQRRIQPLCTAVYFGHRSRLLLVASSSSSSPVHFRSSAQKSCYSNSSGPHDNSISNEIVVQRLGGLPVLSIPMPSRRERCRFVLKPLANSLSDLAAFMKLEDPAIEQVSAYTEDGHLLSSLTTVELLLSKNFYLHINNEKFLVRAPDPGDHVSREHVEDLSDVKQTIARLYRALFSEQYHLTQQRHLLAQLEDIKVQLEPLERVRMDLHARATKRARVLSWVGLGLMGLQFGFLARLTWWEYSWDIMEPVTYFVTYGTAMAMFAYHVLTTQDYSYPDAYDREVVTTIHQLSKKNNFDISKYNRLHSEKARIEYDLNRLRSPLDVKLNPPHLSFPAFSEKAASSEPAPSPSPRTPSTGLFKIF